MKRILLFLATNLAIVLVLSLSMRLLGVCAVLFLILRPGNGLAHVGD